MSIAHKAVAFLGKPHGTKFGYLENCTLAKAVVAVNAGQRDRITQADHRGACNHIACSACGVFPVKRWAKRHRLKGAVIADDTVDLLLTWCDLSIHSQSVTPVLRFLDAIEELRDAFRRSRFGLIAGFVGATEYNPPPSGGFGKVQPHFHLSILLGRMSLVPLLKAIKKFWIVRGGKALLLRDFDSNGLSGVIGYLNKHPLKAFNDSQRLKLHRYVMNAVERRRKAPAAIRFIGGRALSGHGFMMMRARANFECFRRAGASLSQKLQHPDRKADRYCPTVRRVCPVKACPRCKSYGKHVKKNGTTSAGRVRWRCKDCGRSWVEKPILAGRDRTSQTKALNRRIRRAWQTLGSIAAVSTYLGVSKGRVRKALAP